jgi:threonyl-tRNA synthetase
MVAFLREQHAGRLPLWLAPVQICLLLVHYESPAAELRQRGLRVRVESHGR